MKRVLALVLGLLAVSGSPAGAAPAAAPKCPAQPVNGTPAAVISSLQKGFNLPGWLDQSRPRRPDRALLEALAKAGFTHVRLPFEPQLVLTNFEKGLLNELDRALDQLIELGFTISLDNHPGARFTEGYEERPDEGYDRLLRAWMAVADHVKTRSREKVFFELWNEPQISPGLWRAHATKLITALRASDPERTIIFGDAPFQRYDALIAERPLPFTNVVYAVHFYDPMTFTHQGAEWMKGSPVSYLRGVPFPSQANDPRVEKLKAGLASAGHTEALDVLADQYDTPWTKERITAEFARTGDWAKSHGVHIIVNEFGVLRGAAPTEDRLAWLKAVRQAAETYCMGWTHWELLDGFGFVGADGRTLDTGVAEALLTP